jgi:hypothetical protein
VSIVTARLLPKSSTEDQLIGFRCSGKKHGNACNKLLLEMHPDALRAEKQLRVKCKDCNAMNTFIGTDAA